MPALAPPAATTSVPPVVSDAKLRWLAAGGLRPDPVGAGGQQHVGDGRVAGLTPIALIEDQRVLAEPPRAAVAEAPEGHALDVVPVVDEDREEPGVSVP